MSDFRPGDRRIVLGGQPVRLRLTISALAEIAAHFGAKDAGDLAVKIRAAGQGEWNAVYAALATPRPTAPLPPAELAKILPDLSAVMVEGLAP